MHNYKTLFLSSLLLFFFFNTIAQPKNNSPYSRFGIGDIHDDNFVFGQGFGSLGATNIDPWHVNIVNPASYSYLQATSFEVGLDASYSNMKSGDETANIFSGNVNYFTLGLPLINPINDVLERVKRDYDLGLVFALKPYSLVGYNIVSEEDHPDEGTIERQYTGQGGTYKFMTGISGRYKDFSLGVNGGYLFGNIKYRNLVYFASLPYAYHNDFREQFYVNGFFYNVGATYSLVLNKSKLNDENNIQANKIVIGVYGNTKNSFRASGSIYKGAEITTFELGEQSVDTLRFDDQITGSGTLPSVFGAGISYIHGKKLTLGINYERSLWSQYKNEVKSTDEILSDAFKISGGVDYVPDHFSYTNPFLRMHYRMGFHYLTDGRSEDGIQLSEAALNLGLGIPFVFKRKTSHIDLSLQLGQTIGDISISESFVKFGIGLTFNDQEWFLKRRYY